MYIYVVICRKFSFKNIFINKYPFVDILSPSAPLVEGIFVPTESLGVGIEDGTIIYIESIKRYKVIMFGLPPLYYRDVIFSILTDELIHATLYNYLFTKISNIK